MRDRVFGDHVGAARIDLVHEIETAHVGLGNAGKLDGAGIIDDDVERTERRRSFVDRVLHRLFVAHVDHERQGAAARLLDLLGGAVDRAGELGMRRLGLGGDRDIGAVARGFQRDRQPDAARGAGDEQRLAVKRRHRVLLPQIRVQPASAAFAQTRTAPRGVRRAVPLRRGQYASR